MKILVGTVVLSTENDQIIFTDNETEEMVVIFDVEEAEKLQRALGYMLQESKINE